MVPCMSSWSSARWLSNCSLKARSPSIRPASKPARQASDDAGGTPAPDASTARLASRRGLESVIFSDHEFIAGLNGRITEINFIVALKLACSLKDAKAGGLDVLQPLRPEQADFLPDGIRGAPG